MPHPIVLFDLVDRELGLAFAKLLIISDNIIILDIKEPLIFPILMVIVLILHILLQRIQIKLPKFIPIHRNIHIKLLDL